MDKKQTAKLDFTSDIDFSQILTNPILDIAARFWEEDRYQSFRICYRSMRVIDDLVDDRKVLSTELKQDEKEMLQRSIEDWNKALIEDRPQDEFQQQLLKTIGEFKIPKWPWTRLCRAMVYDIHHDSFPTFLSFVRYTEGAAIAPASIFMHLCGVSKHDGDLNPPPYNIRLAARALALFSYLVHIIRDFEKDQKSGLNYFALDLMEQHKLSIDSLSQIAANGQPTHAFRDLMANYYRIAESYRIKAKENIENYLPYLEPRYKLSLATIYELYLQIFERIDPISGRFTKKDLNPTPKEIQARLDRTISSFATLI